MNEETPIVHTFSSDIEEEIRKKDATIIDVATSGINKISPADPPNYKIIFILVIIFIIITILTLSFYTYKNNLENTPSINTLPAGNTKDSSLITTSVKISNIKQDELAIYMPDSKNSLSPYIKLINQNKGYMLYKVITYDGLQSALLNNEDKIIYDLTRYYGYSEPFDKFKDVNMFGVDMRAAKETLTTGNKALYYGVVNRAYVIFANSNISWKEAYNQTLK